MRVSRMNQSISQVFVVDAKLFPVPRVAPILLHILWSTKYSLDDCKNTPFIALNLSVFNNFKNIMSVTATTWVCSNSQWRTGIFAKFSWQVEEKGFHRTPYDQKIQILTSYCSILKYLSEWECLHLKRWCHLSLSDKRSFQIQILLKTDICREGKV